MYQSITSFAITTGTSHSQSASRSAPNHQATAKTNVTAATEMASEIFSPGDRGSRVRSLRA